MSNRPVFTKGKDLFENMKAISLFIAQDGVYEVRRTELGVFCARISEHDIPELEPCRNFFKSNLPKIPFALHGQAVALFKKFCFMEEGIEAMCQVLWDRGKNEYTLFVPKQDVSKYTTDAVIDSAEYYEQQMCYIDVMDIHSHNTMEARFSLRDDQVEKKNLLRQNFIESDITYNKAEVLVNRYGNVYGISDSLGVVAEYAEDADSVIEVLSNGEGVPLLVGCVDNNATRKIFHEVFQRMDNLLYIDAGNGTVNPDDPDDNGKWTGQVVVGLKEKGKVILPPVVELYPDVLADKESKLPSQSCGDHVISQPQLMATNGMSAMIVFAYINSIVAEGKLSTHITTFNVQNTLSRPRYITEEMVRGVGVKDGLVM